MAQRPSTAPLPRQPPRSKKSQRYAFAHSHDDDPTVSDLSPQPPTIPRRPHNNPVLTTVANQPCCVCKDEKAKRDECMLFSSAPDPSKDCLPTILQYKSCMEGFGFKV